MVRATVRHPLIARNHLNFLIKRLRARQWWSITFSATHRSTAGGSQDSDFAEEISLHAGEMVGGGGEAVLMRCVNGPPSAEAAELLGLLGATGFENGVAQNVIVSRSCAVASTPSG